MGTTQRIIPGVTGEPNWGNLNIAVTSFANAVEKEQEIEKEMDDAKEKNPVSTPESIEQAQLAFNKQQQLIHSRKNHHFTSALRNLIRTGGGKSSVTTGRSRSLGRAGLKNAKRLTGFITAVASTGLQQVLTSAGFGSLKGKSTQEVIDFLLIYFADSSSGMDESAANMASCQIVEKLSEGINTVEALEDKLKELAEGNLLTELVCTFYGLYLYEHLSQRFQEKITQIKGEAVSKEIFMIIRDDILAQVMALSKTQSLSEINWKGQSGKALEEKIFSSIIQIFE